jgi:glutamate--cysteine ligase
MEEGHVIGLKQVYYWKYPCYSLDPLYKLCDNLFLCTQGKQNISLEPGGQFELSGAPLETLHQTCAEVNSHLYQVNFSK